MSENQPGEVPDDERLRLYIKVPAEKDEEEVKEHFRGRFLLVVVVVFTVVFVVGGSGGSAIFRWKLKL